MNLDSTVIEFRPNGAVEAMHREDMLPLGFLGAMSIQRASDIRFNTETQLWGICIANTDGTFADPLPYADDFKTYETARDNEVMWFEEARLMGVAPGSPDGHLIIRAMRIAEFARGTQVVALVS